MAAAHPSADTGPTSGGSIIYEVQNVQEALSAAEVVAAFKNYRAPEDRFEIDFAELTAAL